MTRLLFPADRTAYVYTGLGAPILVPFHQALTLYSDQACFNLAGIVDQNNSPILGSVVHTDDAGLIPEFYGPDNLTRLWAKPLGGTAYPIDANFGVRIDGAATTESVIATTTALITAQHTLDDAAYDPAGAAAAITPTSIGAATSASVTAAVAALVNAAPGAMDTLGEIATIIASDETAAATLLTSVGTKATTVALNAEAVLARNATNLTSGTVADARLPSTAQAATLSSTFAPAFVVAAPTGGSITDCANFAAAHALLPVTGGKIILQKSGSSAFINTQTPYDFTNGITVSKSCIIEGAGMAAMGNGEGGGSLDAGTLVISTSRTADILTVTAPSGTIRDVAFRNTAGLPPTAGTAIRVASELVTQSVNYDKISVSGFYDNISIDVGCGWNMHGCRLFGPVRFGLRVRNIVNGDAGDWSISDSLIWASVYDSMAGIRIESSGGGKITNCKINANASTHLFTHGIDIDFAAGMNTGDFAISNTSIENVTGNGINMYSATAAWLQKIHITGCQISLLGTNTTGYAIAAEGQTQYTVGLITIAGCILTGATGGVGPAIALTNATNVRMSGTSFADFSSLYTATGCILIAADADAGAVMEVTAGVGAPDDVPLFATSSQTPADVPGVSLRFTVGSSGKVLVKIVACYVADAAANFRWRLAEGGVAVPGTTRLMVYAGTSTLQGTAVYEVWVDNLIPGSIHDFQMQGNVAVAGPNAQIFIGPNIGPVLMSVTARP